MARWLSFFAEYNFSVAYKPGRLNAVADALLRRPDFELTAVSNSRGDPTVAIDSNSRGDTTVATLSVSVPSSSLSTTCGKHTQKRNLFCG